jgi:histidine triad (HIT) family protein
VTSTLNRAGCVPDCVFCRIVAGTAPATVLREWPGVLAITPLGGCTAGHVLVIPTVHVPDVGSDPRISALAIAAAAELAAQHPACNVITSKGSDATQTVLHLHIHVVPRRPGDELPLPWTPQQRTEQERRS